MLLRSDTPLGFGATVGEAARIAVGRPVVSLLVGLVVIAVTLAVYATAGRGVQTERAVLDRIDDLGTRLVVITDPQGMAAIPPEAIDRVARLSHVEWVVGLGFAQDGQNAAVPGGAPIPIRALLGSLPSIIETTGRPPGVGEVILGSEAPGGFIMPAGGIIVQDVDLAVVGAYLAGEPLEFMNRGGLVIPAIAGPVRSLHILTDSPDAVASVTDAVLTVVGADNPSAVAVETSQTLAELRAVVAGELARTQRLQTLQALSIGLVLIAATVYGSVTLQRQDHGRRRALGAGRMTIIALIALQQVVVAVAALVVGTGIGMVVVQRLTGTFPALDVVVAIGVLVVLSTVVATLPPAFIAAWRDPVRVLRMP